MGEVVERGEIALAENEFFDVFALFYHFFHFRGDFSYFFSAEVELCDLLDWFSDFFDFPFEDAVWSFVGVGGSCFAAVAAGCLHVIFMVFVANLKRMSNI